MKYKCFIVILFLCNLCFSQTKKSVIREVKKAKIMDTVFFNQLDSIVENRYNKHFTFYNLMFCDKDERMDIETNVNPTPFDSVYYFMLQGTSVATRDFLVDYKDRKYNLRGTALGIIIREESTIEILSPLGVSIEDLKAPLLILKYKNNHLEVIKEYR